MNDATSTPAPEPFQIDDNIFMYSTEAVAQRAAEEDEKGHAEESQSLIYKPSGGADKISKEVNNLKGFATTEKAIPVSKRNLAFLVVFSAIAIGIGVGAGVGGLGPVFSNQIPSPVAAYALAITDVTAPLLVAVGIIYLKKEDARIQAEVHQLEIEQGKELEKFLVDAKGYAKGFDVDAVYNTGIGQVMIDTYVPDQYAFIKAVRAAQKEFNKPPEVDFSSRVDLQAQPIVGIESVLSFIRIKIFEEHNNAFSEEEATKLNVLLRPYSETRETSVVDGLQHLSDEDLPAHLSATKEGRIQVYSEVMKIMDKAVESATDQIRDVIHEHCCPHLPDVLKTVYDKTVERQNPSAEDIRALTHSVIGRQCLRDYGEPAKQSESISFLLDVRNLRQMLKANDLIRARALTLHMIELYYPSDEASIPKIVEHVPMGLEQLLELVASGKKGIFTPDMFNDLRNNVQSMQKTFERQRKKSGVETPQEVICKKFMAAVDAFEKECDGQSEEFIEQRCKKIIDDFQLKGSKRINVSDELSGKVKENLLKLNDDPNVLATLFDASEAEVIKMTVDNLPQKTNKDALHKILENAVALQKSQKP